MQVYDCIRDLEVILCISLSTLNFVMGKPFQLKLELIQYLWTLSVDLQEETHIFSYPNNSNLW